MADTKISALSALTTVADDDDFVVSDVTNTSNKRVTGSTLAGYVGAKALGPVRYTFDTGTGSGPASGELRLNNATPSSATIIYVHETDANSVGIGAILSEIRYGDRLLVFGAADSSKFALYKVNGDPVDNGSDRTIPVAHIASNSTLADAAACVLIHDRCASYEVDIAQAGSDTLSAATISTTETAFANTVTIPANALYAGVIEMLLAFLSTTTSASAPTQRYRVRKDNASGTILYDTGAQAPGNSFTGQPGLMPFAILGTAAPGASVNVNTHHVGRSNHNFEGNSSAVAQPVALPTNAALTLCLTVQFSANTAGNSVTLDSLARGLRMEEAA